MDWGTFETAWHDIGCRALADMAVAYPDERLYAAAFHVFYADGTVIFPPSLAANAEAAVHNYGYSTRFAPPEWRWPVLDAACEAMQPWYLRLTEEFLTSADDDAERDAALESLWSTHDAAIARVCKALTTTARLGGIHSSLPTTFVVAILEGQRGDEEADLIRASVDLEVLTTVPELVEHLRVIEEA